MKIKSYVLLFSLCALTLAARSVEDEIRANELTIDSLQRELDATRAEGDSLAKIESLRERIDETVKRQNKLLEEKAAESERETPSKETSPLAGASLDEKALDARIRRVVREELAALKRDESADKPLPAGANPYDGDTRHKPTAAELSATSRAEAEAPNLPEANSPAMAQYQQALDLYNGGSYKEAGASFARVVKTYPKDPIVAKALVHLAFSLEKQGNLESAAVVCESALTGKIDDIHKIDCNLIRLKHAKAKGNDKETKEITNILKPSIMSPEQKAELDKLIGSKPAKGASKPKGGK